MLLFNDSVTHLALSEKKDPSSINNICQHLLTVVSISDISLQLCKHPDLPTYSSAATEVQCTLHHHMWCFHITWHPVVLITRHKTQHTDRFCINTLLHWFTLVTTYFLSDLWADFALPTPFIISSYPWHFPALPKGGNKVALFITLKLTRLLKPHFSTVSFFLTQNICVTHLLFFAPVNTISEDKEELRKVSETACLQFTCTQTHRCQTSVWSYTTEESSDPTTSGFLAFCVSWCQRNTAFVSSNAISSSLSPTGIWHREGLNISLHRGRIFLYF